MTRFILSLFLFWRISLFAISYLASYLLPVFGNRFPYWRELLASSGLPQWIWAWGNFDGIHYLTIAQSGYSAQFTQAFFPFYPLVIRIIAEFLGTGYLITGLLVSNISTVIFLLLFAYLLRLEGFKENAIKQVIIFTLIFPFSFFFVSVYNESLFLTLVLASIIAARKNHWFWAGIFGAFASATRVVGIFLLPVLLVEWWIKKSKIKSQISVLGRGEGLKVFWIFLVSLGLLSYMWYLGKTFSDPLYFVHAQPVFGASRSGGQIVLLPQVIWRYLKIFATVPFTHYDFLVAAWEFGFFWVFVFFTLFFWQKIRLSYLIFALLVVFTPPLTGTFSSIPRYLLVAFPMFIMHIFIKRKWLKLIIIGLYILFLFVFTTLFIRGYWVS